MRILVALVVASAVAVAMFGKQSHETLCDRWSRCDPVTEIKAFGWPAAYWYEQLSPSDPPYVSATRFDPVELALDVAVFGLVLSAAAIAGSAIRWRWSSSSR